MARAPIKLFLQHRCREEFDRAQTDCSKVNNLFISASLVFLGLENPLRMVYVVTATSKAIISLVASLDLHSVLSVPLVVLMLLQ